MIVPIQKETTTITRLFDKTFKLIKEVQGE